MSGQSSISAVTASSVRILGAWMIRHRLHTTVIQTSCSRGRVAKIADVVVEFVLVDVADGHPPTLAQEGEGYKM
jgi:hypothetical protein